MGDEEENGEIEDGGGGGNGGWGMRVEERVGEEGDNRGRGMMGEN